MLTGLTFTSSAWGPAIVSEGAELVVNECRFVANPLSALRVINGNLSVLGSIFQSNGDAANAALEGGALYIRGGNLDVFNSLFLENSASVGGAIFVCDVVHVRQLHVSNSRFDSNVAIKGGVIYAKNARGCWIRNTSFTSNKAAAEGGALYAANSSITLANQSLVENTNEAHGSDWSAQPSGAGRGQGAGSSIFVTSAAIVLYALPAPFGHWIANPVQVQPDAQTCHGTALVLHMTMSFPVHCVHGLLVWSDLPAVPRRFRQRMRRARTLGLYCVDDRRPIRRPGALPLPSRRTRRVE